TQGGRKSTTTSDGTIQIASGAKKDTYTIEAPVGATALQALRLETLPESGQAGDFIITRLSAAVTPPPGQALAGRFVRIEIPGKQKILSLAEVQVFQGNDNIALKGEAKQSSTDFDAHAKLAIDGKTDGRFTAARSTTHTTVSDNPWWEVDLKAGHHLDRIVVWNRTDPGTEERLSNFHLLVLDERRRPVWQQDVAAVPRPSAAF